SWISCLNGKDPGGHAERQPVASDRALITGHRDRKICIAEEDPALNRNLFRDVVRAGCKVEPIALTARSGTADLLEHSRLADIDVAFARSIGDVALVAERKRARL